MKTPAYLVGANLLAATALMGCGNQETAEADTPMEADSQAQAPSPLIWPSSNSSCPATSTRPCSRPSPGWAMWAKATVGWRGIWPRRIRPTLRSKPAPSHLLD